MLKTASLIGKKEERNVGGTTVAMRKVMNSGKISKKDEAGIVKLYEALVPIKVFEHYRMDTIRSLFPTFDDIDVDMIVTEAFPHFEECIGKDAWNKVKAHFGIGVNKPKQFKTVELYLGMMRTVENAQYYISGYRSLVSKIAQHLEGAPECMNELEKAKVLRMYMVIFCRYNYFCMDYRSVTLGMQSRIVLRHDLINGNNALKLGPEELILEYVASIYNYRKETFCYDRIMYEFEKLDKRLIRDVLGFAELKYRNGIFKSENRAIVGQTYGSVRAIKSKIHQELGMRAMEYYANIQDFMEMDMYSTYFIYKVLKTKSIDELESVEHDVKRFEGSRMLDAKQKCVKVTEEIHFGGPVEIDRFISAVEYFARRGLTNRVRLTESEKDFDLAFDKFFQALLFASNMGYIDADSSAEKDLEIAIDLLEHDKDECLKKYQTGLITAGEVKMQLGIDAEYEQKNYGVVQHVSPLQIATDFAVSEGYVDSPDEIDQQLVFETIIDGNEETLEKFHAGEISKSAFKKAIGFAEEFGEMFFDLSAINVEELESKLLEVKRNSIGKKRLNGEIKSVVKLYCYVVEEQIACGPKNKVPKRNKSLKPAILRDLIT